MAQKKENKIREILNVLESEITQSTSDVSNVCRTMSLALFAAVIFDILGENKSEWSLFVVLLAVFVIFLDLLQYGATTIAVRVWSYKLCHRKITKDQYKESSRIFQKVCLVIVALKVTLVILNTMVVIMILIHFI